MAALAGNARPCKTILSGSVCLGPVFLVSVVYQYSIVLLFSKLKNERDAKVAVLKTKEAEKAELTIKGNQLKDGIGRKNADIRKLQDEETKLQTRLTSFE